jgi:hypothetical protein
MKTALILSIIFLVNIFPVADASAQSPYYSLLLSIKDDTTADKNSAYKIYHRLCVSDERIIGDFFTNDTSNINWNDPPPEFFNSLKCIETSELISHQFKYSDQVMMYEMIVHLMIIDEISQDTMQIVFPVKIKSFVTSIDLENIPFKKGIYEIDNGLEYSLDGMRLRMKLRDDYEWRAVEGSRLVVRKG